MSPRRGWKHGIPCGIGLRGPAEPRVTREGFVPAPPALTPDTGAEERPARGCCSGPSPGCGDGEPGPDLPQPQPGLELQLSSAEPLLTFTDSALHYSPVRPLSSQCTSPPAAAAAGLELHLTRRCFSLQKSWGDSCVPSRAGGEKLMPGQSNGSAVSGPAKSLCHQHTGHCAEPFLGRECGFPSPNPSCFSLACISSAGMKNHLAHPALLCLPAGTTTPWQHLHSPSLQPHPTLPRLPGTDLGLHRRKQQPQGRTLSWSFTSSAHFQF